jgi:hypothetical protein
MLFASSIDRSVRAAGRGEPAAAVENSEREDAVPGDGEGLSRRDVLRRAALTLGALGVVASTGAAAQAQAPTAAPGGTAQKQTKQQAAYQDHPNGPQSCGICAHFIAPNKCEIVEGAISPTGWCRNFKAKT